MRGTRPTFQNIPLYRDSKAEIINPVIINGAHARKPQFNVRTFDNRDVDTRSDTTRQGRHEGNIPYGAGRGPAGESPLSILEQNVVKSDVITGSPTILPGRLGKFPIKKVGKPIIEKLRLRSGYGDIRIVRPKRSNLGDPDVKIVKPGNWNDPDVRIVQRPTQIPENIQPYQAPNTEFNYYEDLNNYISPEVFEYSSDFDLGLFKKGGNILNKKL